MPSIDLQIRRLGRLARLEERLKPEFFASEAAGFISFRGKFTKDFHGYFNIGEHDEKNKLTGKGIIIAPNRNICLGYYKDGQNALGNFINIYFDG